LSKYKADEGGAAAYCYAVSICALKKAFERAFEVYLKLIPVSLGAIPQRFVTGKLLIKTLQ